MVLPLVRRFNSIKVQLEHSQKLAIKQLIQFQFHKGAIRTHNQQRMCVDGGWFQFHKGAIRTLMLALKWTSYLRFNSIKVQLEQVDDALKRLPVNLFQFHKGAIRTVGKFHSELAVDSFNSIKVQLEQN